MLQFMGSPRVRHDWATELIWTELGLCLGFLYFNKSFGKGLNKKIITESFMEIDKMILNFIFYKISNFLL